MKNAADELPGAAKLNRRGIIPRLLFSGIALAALGALLVSLDIQGAYSLLTSIGWLLLFAPLPYFLSGLVDSFGWRLLFPQNDTPGYWRTAFVRFATEALYMSIPGGVAFSDPMKPLMLSRNPGIETSRSIPAMGARRTLILVSHGFFILLASMIGWSDLGSLSVSLKLGSWLPYGTMAIGVLIFCLGSVSTLGLIFGGLGRRLYGLLFSIPILRFRERLKLRRKNFLRTDFELRQFRHHPRAKIFYSLIAFTAVWLLESVETWLFLQLLQVPVSLPMVMVFESVMTVVRSILFFLPSGIGIQDLSYVALLRAFYPASADAASAAVILLRRLRETLFIIAGYGMLAIDLRNAGSFPNSAARDQ